MRVLAGVSLPEELLSLPELVALANQLLPGFLPEDLRDSRQREEVNPRLVRHLTTLGLLDEALRQGREARYTPLHLLQLLVVRRLMAEGYNTGATKKLIAGATEERLEALLQGEAQPSVEPQPLRVAVPGAALRTEDVPAEEHPSGGQATANSALDYLHNLRRKRAAGKGVDDKGTHAPSPSTSSPIASLQPAAPPSPARPHSTSPHPPRASHQPRWVRVEAAPGLEIHVREDWVLPATPYEQGKLLQRVLDELKELRAGQASATKRRSP